MHVQPPVILSAIGLPIPMSQIRPSWIRSIPETALPEPPNSLGKSLSFGRPLRIGKPVEQRQDVCTTKADCAARSEQDRHQN
jgi:hypothetical protein